MVAKSLKYCRLGKWQKSYSASRKAQQSAERPNNSCFVRHTPSTQAQREGQTKAQQQASNATYVLKKQGQFRSTPKKRRARKIIVQSKNAAGPGFQDLKRHFCWTMVLP